jgi:hypothetical protein
MGNQTSREDLNINIDKTNTKYFTNNYTTKNNFSNQKSRNNKNVAILTSEKKDSSDSGFLKDNSSYKGVKSLTDYSSRSGSQGGSFDKGKEEATNDVTELSIKESSREQEIREVKVMTNFVWKEGGREVYLTGSFCNWKQTFLMNCVNNRYECNLVKIYKFIKILIIFIFQKFRNCLELFTNTNSLSMANGCSLSTILLATMEEEISIILLTLLIILFKFTPKKITLTMTILIATTNKNLTKMDKIALILIIMNILIITIMKNSKNLIRKLKKTTENSLTLTTPISPRKKNLTSTPLPAPKTTKKNLICTKILTKTLLAN